MQYNKGLCVAVLFCFGLKTGSPYSRSIWHKINQVPGILSCSTPTMWFQKKFFKITVVLIQVSVVRDLVFVQILCQSQGEKECLMVSSHN